MFTYSYYIYSVNYFVISKLLIRAPNNLLKLQKKKKGKGLQNFLGNPFLIGQLLEHYF
jgi:hypothetical protein